MQILLVAEDDSYAELLRPFFQPRGCRIIHYRHPLKAQDNLREIEPDIILYNASDFPRHWKLMLQTLREKYTKRESVFILLEEEDFPIDEADKALYLGANGIIFTEDLRKQNYEALENLLSRYRLLPSVGSTAAYLPSHEETISFIFPHPGTGKLITGIITALSLYEASFEADAPTDILDLTEGSSIQEGRLKMGTTLVTLPVIIKKNMGKVVTFTLDTKEKMIKNSLKKYLLQRAGVTQETLAQGGSKD